MCRQIAILMLIIGAGHTTISANAAVRFTVGPDQPHKTISSALAAMKDGDVCLIAAGVYRERIDVRKNDVTLLGQGRVVITGCDEAAEIQPIDVNGKKGLEITVGAPVYDVFRGSQYLMPARWPNKTSPMTSNKDWEESFIAEDGKVRFNKQEQRVFSQLADGYYIGLHGADGAKHGKLSSWYSISLPVTGIEEDGMILVDGENASSGYMSPYGRGKGLGYIIGAKAVLDAPGEWYSDGQRVLLIPPDGEAGKQDRYELRTRLYGAVVTGNGVRIENVRFKAAAVRVDGDNVSLKSCVFEYISPFQHNPRPRDDPKNWQSLASGWGVPQNGTAGVFVQGNGFVAENCRFSKSWWGGMTVRGNNARIENCLFEDMNWIAKRCAALHAWGDDIVVRYCTFRNLGGAAIEGGNANWIGQYAKNNVWEYNYIENVCQLIVDQGFFYVNHQKGSNPKANSIWRYNVGVRSRGPVKGKWTQTTVGYYVDNSSSGYYVHNNIAIDANEAIRYNDTYDGADAGKDVWFYNNTFHNCGSIGFGWWGGDGGVPDAEFMLINNLAIPSGIELHKPIEIVFKAEVSRVSRYAIRVRDTNGKDLVEFRFRGDGQMTIGHAGQRALGTYSVHTPYTIRLALDFAKETVNAYVDETLRTQDWPLENLEGASRIVNRIAYPDIVHHVDNTLYMHGITVNMGSEKTTIANFDYTSCELGALPENYGPATSRIVVIPRTAGTDDIHAMKLTSQTSGASWITFVDFNSMAAKRYGWKNNLSLPVSALNNPGRLDFTPIDENLKHGGIPFLDQKISFIGAVDPAKGMWRYGANESKLPGP